MAPADRVVPLHWDSRFFGFRIGRATGEVGDEAQVRALDNTARDAGFRCIYLDVEPSEGHDTVLLQRLGYLLVEVALDLEHPTNQLTVRPPTRSTVRWGRVEDFGAACAQVQEAAVWSRFAVDPNFGAAAADRLQRSRIERALERGSGRRLLVAEDPGGVTGVATVAGVGTAGRTIDLIATTHPGSGAAQALVAFAFEQFGPGSSRGGPIAARNVASLRFSETMGYRVERTRYVYHRWLDE